MRSHLKLSLVLAVAMFPALTLAGDDPVLTKADRLLNKEAAAKMFNKFSVGKQDEDKMAVLYGTTSESCMKFVKVTNDAEAGEFTITVKQGADERCLDFAKLPKEETKFPGLSEQEGAKLVFSATLSKLVLRSEDPQADRDRVVRDELTLDDGTSVAFTSAKDLAAEKKKAEAAKADEKILKDQLLVSSCYRGLTELDIGSEALGRLSKIKSVVDEKGDEWFKKKQKEINARIFAGCSKQIQKGATDALDDINGCHERLSKLVAEDESYASKVKDLYMSLINRYATSSSLSVKDGYDKALDVMDRLSGMDLSDAEEKSIESARKQLLMSGLQKAQFLGEGEDFDAMKETYFAAMMGEDGDKGCLDENGILAQGKRGMDGRPVPACMEVYKMSAQLQNATVIAKGITPVLKARAAAAAAVAVAAEQKQLKLNACAATKSIGGAETAECAALAKQEAAAASAVANQGLTGEAFGSVKTETPAAEKPAAAESDAGIIKSSTAVQDARLTQSVLTTPPVAPAPVVTSVQVFRN